MSLQDKQYDTFGSGLAEGAGKGFEDFFVKPAEEQRKSKLEMQMMSQRIEMEHAARQKEDAVQQALKSIPPDQFQAVMNQSQKFKLAMASGTPPEPLDTTGITHPAAQQLLEGMITHNDNAGNTTRVIDQDGRQVLLTTAQNGKELRRTDLGLTKNSQKMIQQASAQYNEADGLLKAIEMGASSFIKATDPVQRAQQYASMKMNELTQSNPEAAAYMANAINHAIRIEKLISGSARITEIQREEAKNSIPTMADTVQVMDAKIASLRRIFNAAHGAAMTAYSTSPSEILKDFDEDHFGGIQPKDRASQPKAPSQADSLMDFNKFYEMRHPEPQKGKK